MPHSTRASSASRAPAFKFPGDASSNIRTSMEKFPDHTESFNGQSLYPTSPTGSNGGYISSPASSDRWPPRRDSAYRGSSWATPHMSSGGRHGRQKSLSDALRTIRTRRGSVTANVQEISDALKAPVSPTLIVCDP